jgi:hypothetical protein
MKGVNILLIIFIIGLIIIIIHNKSNKSTFKLRRSIPLEYYSRNGNIYSIYGAVGNPNMLYGQAPPNINNYLFDKNASIVFNSL